MGLKAYQSPQSVISRTSCCGVKYSTTGQLSVLGYEAVGTPQEEISRGVLEMVEGISLRGKNHMLGGASTAEGRNGNK